MKDGKYYSKKYKRYAWVYHITFDDGSDMPLDCHKCGKYCKHPICFVWEDDEQNLENTYGPECITQFKFERVNED